MVAVIGILVAIAIPLFRDAPGQKTGEVGDAANVQALNSATALWVSEDPENNDPDLHQTGSLRPLIEGRLVNGWPVSPTGGRYVLEEGRWVYRE